jgi:hypothetical protein
MTVEIMSERVDAYVYCKKCKVVLRYDEYTDTVSVKDSKGKDYNTVTCPSCYFPIKVKRPDWLKQK